MNTESKIAISAFTPKSKAISKRGRKAIAIGKLIQCTKQSKESQ